MRWFFRTSFILFSLLLFLASCSINRENMWDIATSAPVPDLVVLGYPNGTGAYDFGDVDVYTNGKATFIIRNADRGTLHIYGISFLEDDVERYTIDTSSLSCLLCERATTVFTVRFKPIDNTEKEATVIIFNNCPEKNPYTFTVKGCGTGIPASTPDINVRQGTMDIPAGSLVEFGTVQTETSGSKLFMIENIDTGQLEISNVSIEPGGGAEPGEFSIICPSVPTSLTQDESTEFTVVFSPQNVGIKSATVSISSDDPDENPYSFAVQGTGTAVPEPDICIKEGENELPDSSGSHHFGFVQCGNMSPSAIFMIGNTGSADLTITSITLTAGLTDQFTIDTSGTLFTLAPSSETTFSLQFTPDLPEEYKWATVTIDNNDPDEDPFTFTVEGEGVASGVPDINLQEVAHNSEYYFSPVPLGSSKTETFTVDNTGTADLNITSIVNNSPDKFTLDDSMTLFLVPPGSTTTFDIIFTPEDTKNKSAVIEVHSDDPDEPLYKFKAIAHGSYGPEPNIKIKQGAVQYPDGSQYYFPDTEVGGESAPVMFTVENNGTGDLVLESILLVWKHVGDFCIDYDEGQMIVPPGSSISVTVWFRPTIEGARQTKLYIKSNDPDEDESEIKLLGTGLDD